MIQAHFRRIDVDRPIVLLHCDKLPMNRSSRHRREVEGHCCCVHSTLTPMERSRLLGLRSTSLTVCGFYPVSLRAPTPPRAAAVDEFGHRPRFCSFSIASVEADFQKLLDRKTPPKTRAFNLLLTKTSRAGDHLSVFELYGKMVSEGRIFPDVCTGGILISSANKMGRVEMGLAVLSDVHKRGIQPNALLVTALLKGLLEQRRMQEAFEVFGKMPECGVYPDVVTYNTIISSCFAEIENFELGFNVFSDMLKRGCHADIVTFNALIYGLCKSGRIATGLALLNRMPETGCVANAVTYNTLIDFLVQHENGVDMGLGIFCNMLKHGQNADNITLNILLNGLCKARRIFDVTVLFRRMAEMGCIHDVTSYGTLLDLCCQSDLVDLGFAVFCNMLKFSCTPNTVIFSVLVNGLCKVNRIADAITMFKQMSELVCPPNAITYSSLVSCCCRLGRIGLGSAAFADMLKHGHVCDTVTLTALLNGFSKADRFLDASGLFIEMSRMGCLPNAVTYGSFIDCCCESGRIDLGFGLLCDMLKRGHHANIIILNSLVHGLSMTNDVSEAAVLIEKMIMTGCLPDVITFTSLIKGLSRMGNVSLAVEVLREMKQPGTYCGPDVITYNTVIGSLCEVGEMDVAEELLQEMKNEGINPNTYTYSYLIRGFTKLGNWERAIQLSEAMFYKDLSAFSMS